MTLLDGRALAAGIRSDLTTTIDRLADRGHRPGLATVHMGTDPAAETYIDLKQRDCDRLGIRGRHVDIGPDAPERELHETIADLNDDPEVDGILVQDDVPDGVDWLGAVRQIDPAKDVDGLHPENLGRLLAGDPQFVPCTPLGVERLLAAENVPLEGQDVVIVNHSNIVGKPLAALLVQKTDGTAAPAAKDVTSAPNATVTICHSATEDLAAKTRDADILVVAVGIPNFLDGSMVTEGTTVVDVGVSRVDGTESGGDGAEKDSAGGGRLTGDVEFDGVAPKADYITPNPGGVGPMTRAMLMYNTVKAAAMQADTAVETPALRV